MLPKITIITPSYNQGQYLEQTIDSVLSQNYPNLEYMVIDGGSKDNSVEIIRKYEKYLAFWVNEKDQGQSDAINKGLQRATGEVLNWLNSDDYYEKNALKIIGEAFTSPSTQVLCGRSRIFFSENNQTSHYSSGTDIYPHNLAKTIGWARIDQPETFFRTSALKQMGLLNPKFHYVMDKEWWIRYLFLFGLAGIQKIQDVLVNFRLHQDSKTVSQQKNFQEETLSIYSEIAQIFQLDILNLPLKEHKLDRDFYQKADKELAQKAIHYHLLYKADASYYTSQYQLAKQYLHKINIHFLEKEDHQLFKKLSFRLNLPHFLLKLIGRLR